MVNCRIGSLETEEAAEEAAKAVNCRIGSLEMHVTGQTVFDNVNCRIGSLEKCHNKYLLCTVC